MKNCRFLLLLVLMVFVLGICAMAADTVYVNDPENAASYATVEAAIDALPDSGGTVIVCGDTEIGTGNKAITFPAKSGKVTIKGANKDVKLTLVRSLILQGEIEIDNLNFCCSSTTHGMITARGHKLTIGENVTTTRASEDALWIHIFGGHNGGTVTTYDTHLVIKAGTWKSIFAANDSGKFSGHATLEISNATVMETLTPMNNSGAFGGTYTYVADLTGGKLVTATTLVSVPTSFLVDDDNVPVQVGTTYKQALAAETPDTVYVDGTGATAGAYTDFVEAFAALPLTGGTIYVSGDTAVADADTIVYFAAKNGKVTVLGENGAKLVNTRAWIFASEVEFDDIELSCSSTGTGFIYASGHKLTIGEGVVTTQTDGGRWMTIFGGLSSASSNTYNTHLVIKAGTYRNIAGANYMTAFTGTSKVELFGGVTVQSRLSAKNQDGNKTFTGTSELILDLRNGKPISAGTWAEAPTAILVEEGYTYTMDGKTYQQVEDVAPDTVYLDGTGATEGAYTTIEAAVAALPATGGTVILTGDTVAGTASSALTLPQKNGKVTFTSENGSKFIIARTLIMTGEVEFNNIGLFSSATDKGYLYAEGYPLTIGENVTTGKTVDEALLIAIFGGTHTSNAMSTDTHLIVRSGTYRAIYGGSYSAAFTGKSTVEVSGITVEDTLAAGNYSGSAYAGTPELILDLRGNKTVTAGTFVTTPTFLVDEGYTYTLDGTTYKQVEDVAPDTVYVDGTGATEGAYTSFEEALAALPLAGGTIYVCGDTTVGVAEEITDLTPKNGKVTVIGQNGAKLINPRTWLLGNEYEFKSIELHSTSSEYAFIFANGHKLTIAEDVTTTVGSNARYLTIFGGVSTESTETYNTHLVIKAGTYRNIAGANYMTAFTGTTKVELSGGVTVQRRLSAKNQDSNKTFTGTSELILDLRGNKTVSAGTWAEAPTAILVDEGYEAVLDGTTYRQQAIHVHDHKAEVTAPTCTDKGYTTYTCACGDTYVADEVPALGHKYVATVDGAVCQNGCGIAYAGNVVVAASAAEIAAGGTATVDVYVKAVGTATFGVEFSLTEGLSIKACEDKLGESTWEIVAADEIASTCKVALVNLDLATDAEGENAYQNGDLDGIVMTLTLEAADTFTGGTLSIEVFDAYNMEEEALEALGGTAAITLAEPPAGPVPGDVTGDGDVTIADVLLILKAMLNETVLENADMNGDGVLTLVDVIKALKAIVA